MDQPSIDGIFVCIEGRRGLMEVALSGTGGDRALRRGYKIFKTIPPLFVDSATCRARRALSSDGGK
jgi:hypothetical protein